MKKTKEKEKKLNNQKQQKILPNLLKLKNILEKMKEHYNINITNNAAKALEGIMNNIKEDYKKKFKFVKIKRYWKNNRKKWKKSCSWY